VSDSIAVNGGAQEFQIMENSSLPQLENEYFHCSWEWHIARLPHSVCAVIYSLAFRVSGRREQELSKRYFFASAKSLATYFNYSEGHIGRGLRELEKAGFFQLIARKKFRPTHYRVLSHEDWAAKHKGQCTAKVEFPWTGEGDPLGQSLWKMSGGQVKFADFQVKSLRKMGMDANTIEQEFSSFWENTGHRMKPIKVPPTFYMHMKSASQAAQGSITKGIENALLPSGIYAPNCRALVSG